MEAARAAYDALTEEQKAPVDPEPTDVPQTGDKANIPLWIGMALIGLLGIIGAGVAVLPKRKK